MMIRQSRSRNSLFNLISGIVGQFFSIVLQFVCRTVFIKCLTVEYLGINGLFSNILSVLSLAELGMGIAIINIMYEPIAKNDTEEITKLVNFYRRMYTCVGTIVISVGLVLIPFLDVLTNGEASKIPNIEAIYILYLLNTAFSYFLAHKKAIVEANQKLYITTTIQKSALIIQNILQIIFLIYTKNFILYLVIQIITTICSNVIISKVADKMYPYLQKNRRIFPSINTKKRIYRNIGAMSIHKLGTVVVYNTDNLIMSMFIGLKTVGVYSNYSLILNNLKTVFNLVFSSFTASVGNLGTEKNNEKLFEVYKMVYFFAVWVYGFISTACIVFMNPLISLWVGEEYKFDFGVVVLLFACFYLDGMRKPTIVFKDALGLFWYDRYKPIAEVSINLVCSIYLVIKIGFVGIFIGTALSCLLTSFWIEPLVVYKYALKKSLTDYFKKYFKWTAIVILIGFISKQSISFIKLEYISGFLCACIIYTLIYNTLFCLFFRRTDEFKAIISKMKKILVR